MISCIHLGGWLKLVAVMAGYQANHLENHPANWGNWPNSEKGLNLVKGVNWVNDLVNICVRRFKPAGLEVNSELANLPKFPCGALADAFRKSKQLIEFAYIAETGDWGLGLI